MNEQERHRVMQLLDQAEPGKSGETVDRILREMPHLVPEDIAHVCEISAGLKSSDVGGRCELHAIICYDLE